jgi:tetratricopeptide (TPR) repeat protein
MRIFFFILPFLLLLQLPLQAQVPSLPRTFTPGESREEAPDNTNEQLAAQYFREGEYEKAVVLYEELFESDSGAVIYSQYLECLFALEDYRRAERVVREQIRRNPGQIRFEVDLGWVLQRAGNDRPSARHFDQLIGGLPANPQAVIDLAGSFERRGLFDRALETYMHGRRMLGPSNPFNLRIAPLLERKGEYKAMMDEYVGYLEENLSEMDRVRGILQDAINNDPGHSRNEALREVLLGRTQRYPNANLYSEMLLWLSIQQKDFRMAFMQARALDRRFQQEGELVLEVAQLSTANESYEVAAQAYQYILEKGEEGTYYLDALVGNLDVRFQSITSGFSYGSEELLALEAEYIQALDDLGIHPATVTLVRNLANLQAFHLGKIEASTTLLNEIINIPQVSQRVRAECRIELADILLLTGQVWDATLLYSQVDRQYRDNPLGHEARYKNARLSYFIGEFDWAKAQLDILKAATSRLVANDAMALSLRIQDNVGSDKDTEPLMRFARAEKLVFMNRFEEALLGLDSIAELFPSHAIADDVLFAKAGVYLKQGEMAMADSLLARVVEEFPAGLLADDALFRRAQLYEQVFNDPEKAMELYQRLMINHPGSLNTVDARNRFRALRGDLVN